MIITNFPDSFKSSWCPRLHISKVILRGLSSSWYHHIITVHDGTYHHITNLSSKDQIIVTLLYFLIALSAGPVIIVPHAHCPGFFINLYINGISSWPQYHKMLSNNQHLGIITYPFSKEFSRRAFLDFIVLKLSCRWLKNRNVHILEISFQRTTRESRHLHALCPQVDNPSLVWPSM